ncbi:hypothetical protein GQ53DRAFT_771245 [Thozetella sp. PMI_491]|nr:hypothetical protein GQ53DRAFT_771245 [Thozetella sp. PMI_491]
MCEMCTNIYGGCGHKVKSKRVCQKAKKEQTRGRHSCFFFFSSSPRTVCETTEQRPRYLQDSLCPPCGQNRGTKAEKQQQLQHRRQPGVGTTPATRQHGRPGQRTQASRLEPRVGNVAMKQTAKVMPAAGSFTKDMGRPATASRGVRPSVTRQAKELPPLPIARVKRGHSDKKLRVQARKPVVRQAPAVAAMAPMRGSIHGSPAPLKANRSGARGKKPQLLAVTYEHDPMPDDEFLDFIGQNGPERQMPAGMDTLLQEIDAARSSWAPGASRPDTRLLKKEAEFVEA